MSISSIVFEKWRGAFDAPPSPEVPKKPSLNRVNENEAFDHTQQFIKDEKQNSLNLFTRKL